MPDAIKPMKRDDVTIHHRTTLHDGHIKVVELSFDAPRFSGETMERVSREVVQRGDAAAALVHDIERDVIILCEQFRAAAYVAGGGWLIELPAGKVDGDESPAECITREIEEELGYRPRSVDPIAVIFPSPGYTSERVHLFYAAVTPADLVNPDASGVDKHEDIRRIEQPLDAFLKRLELGSFEDGKLLAIGAWALSRLRT